MQRYEQPPPIAIGVGEAMPDQNTRQQLVSACNEVPTSQELSLEPMILAKNDQNAEAFARALCLASFDYRKTLGRYDYPKFKHKDACDSFQQPNITTIGIGKERRLLAGITVSDLSIYDQFEDAPPASRLELLFRVRCLSEMDVRNVGKTLLNAALEHVLDAGHEEVDLAVYSENRLAASLYEGIGFNVVCEDGVSKFNYLRLEGQDAVLKAHDILQAQL
jgi:GNAT superfamily N-acetyltransferase